MKAVTEAHSTDAARTGLGNTALRSSQTLRGPRSLIPRVWAAQSRRLRADGGRVLGPGEDGRKRAESVGDRVLFQVLKRIYS